MAPCNQFTDVSEKRTASVFRFTSYKTRQIFLWGVTSFKKANWKAKKRWKFEAETDFERQVLDGR
jgi:hypothetical protein